MVKEITNPEDIGIIEGLRNCEKETNINWMHGDESYILSTTDNATVTKLKHMLEQNPNNYKCYELSSNGRIDSYKFVFSKKCLSFRSGNGRNLSDEQRAAIDERCKNSRDRE